MRRSLSSIWLALLFAACATAKIDWNTRVGQYTYDQAVRELGVPDRTATLSDGSLVAEWLTVRGSTYATYHYFPGSPLQTYDLNQFPDRYLRLTFGPDKRLARADKFAR